MNKLNLFLLAAITLTAICVDCYAGYFLLFMFAMPIGHYLSPFLLLFLVLSVPILFISSIVGLCRLKRWAYWIFFILTLLMHSFLIEEDIYYLKIKEVRALGVEQFFPIAFLLIFVTYFLLPSTRKLFDK
ncbi:MAG: hypothetical protein M0R00_03715 [Candidatus Omnitrophica bacterium]|jgi:hypothetical protein|nr:hypothetical protein [Candidatus Omnitrophota bacterium]